MFFYFYEIGIKGLWKHSKNVQTWKNYDHRHYCVKISLLGERIQTIQGPTEAGTKTVKTGTRSHV